MDQPLRRTSRAPRINLLLLLSLLAAIVSFSCSGSRPSWSVQRPERLHDLQNLAIAPMMIHSFGYDSGLAYDGTTMPFGILQSRLRRSFVPVLFPVSAFEGLRRVPSVDEVMRAGVGREKFDAIVFADFRYLAAGQHVRVELRLRVIDAEDRGTIAEIDAADEGSMAGVGGLQSEAQLAVETVVEIAVRRLEIYRPHRPK